MAARKERAIVASVKHEIIAKIERGERQSSICRELSLSKTTVNSIWRNRKKLKQSLESAGFSIDCKRLRTSNHSDVDVALLVWFKQARSTNIPVSGPLLLEKATVLARALGNKSFTATAGFIDRWKKRHCIIMKKVSGEAGPSATRVYVITRVLHHYVCCYLYMRHVISCYKYVPREL